jgi:NADPH:quinone reductase-like Zn-dependent oxidoreductase
MKAIAIDRFGGNDRIRLVDMAAPTPREDELVIAVRSAGVGQWDGLMRSGELDLGLKQFPIVLGWEGAGVVLASGSKVRRFRLGDRVLFYDFPEPDRRVGAWAEQASVREACVGRVPENLGFRIAGGLPIMALTAAQGLEQGLRVRIGTRILVTAGAGGVGSCAVQLAQRMGAEVIALASPANNQFVHDLGAAVVVDYHGDIAAALRAQRIFEVDCVYHCNWSMETAAKAVGVLKKGGDFCTITGFPDSALAARPDIRAFRKDVEPDGQRLEELAAQAADGRLTIRVQSAYPLERAREALQEVEAGHVHGKVVLEPAVL